MWLILLSLVCLLHFKEATAKSLPPEFLVSDVSDLSAHFLPNLLPVKKWLQTLKQDPVDFLCLGETHDNVYRRYYSELLFSRLKFSVLALEELEEDVDVLVKEHLEGKPISLLGAELGGILSSAFSQNPGLKVVGVEQSPEEDRLRLEEQIHKNTGRISRDGFIALHLSKLLDESKGPVVALYGASHCSKMSDGLGFGVPFFRLLKNVDRFSGKKLMSVYLLPPQKVNQALRVFLDSLKLIDQDMVLVNGDRIPPAAYNYRQDLFNILHQYDAILLPKADYGIGQ